MPKDNSLLPSDNSQQQTTTPPPVLEDVVLPPMVGDKPLAAAEKQMPTNSGSAAPSDDIVMQSQPISSNPRKKFAGGKVIATILGLFLLVGGLGAGVMLVGQNQNIEEQAGCYSTCLREIGDDFECRQVCGRQDGSDGDTPASGGNNTNVEACDCQAGERCNRSGVCVPESSIGEGGVSNPPASTVGSLGSRCDGPTDTGLPACANGLVCYGAQGPSSATCVNPSSVPNWTTGTVCDATTPGVPESMGVCCSTGGTSYNYEDGGSFTGEHWTTCASGYKCQQNYGCVEEPTTGGGGNPPTTPPTTPPVITPSPAPITASCQNVKAYTTAWVELSATQLAALKVTDSVNFCVAGSATGGKFDKAKFTINGVVQTETSIRRPLTGGVSGLDAFTDDFCQNYVLPAATTAFNVTAEIHHVTLGWK